MDRGHALTLLSHLGENADRIRIPTYPHKKSEVSKTDLVNVVKLYTKNAVAAIEGCRFMEAMMTLDELEDFYWRDGNPTTAKVLDAVKGWLFDTATGV